MGEREKFEVEVADDRHEGGWITASFTTNGRQWSTVRIPSDRIGYVINKLRTKQEAYSKDGGSFASLIKELSSMVYTARQVLMDGKQPDFDGMQKLVTQLNNAHDEEVKATVQGMKQCCDEARKG